MSTSVAASAMMVAPVSLDQMGAVIALVSAATVKIRLWDRADATVSMTCNFVSQLYSTLSLMFWF